ncbi:beta strand repeat-containing protein, partial [Rhodocytophaga aerolata]|uniref:beta strand repeat-containing protein n=1 Tax=Rhodocytophaga aerolata TaxID=455078 RepID=UPI003608B851
MIVPHFFYKFRFLWKATVGVVFLLNAIIHSAFADTIVIPATGGNNLCVGSGYVLLGDITVKEQVHDDFNEQTFKNFKLVVPSANFEFLPGTGSVQLISGSGSILSLLNPIVVTSSSITINFDLVGVKNVFDGFIISGIQVRAVGTAASGQILVQNPAQTNDTDLRKNRAGDAVNHGWLISVSPTSSVTTITSSDPDNKICTGELVTFTASPIPGVSYYEFFINGVSASLSTSNTFSTYNLISGQTVTAKGITSSGCTSALSNAITTTVVPLPIANISSSDLDNAICSGESVIFTATPDVSISNYEFFINGISKQSGPSNTFSTSSLTNGQTVTVKTTSLNNCVATSTGIITQVYSKPSVTLTSNDADNTICAGQSVTFTAESVTATSFEFFVNTVSKQHSTLPTYTSTSLADGDIVSVVARNNLGCSATQTLSPFTVYPVPSVTVSSSDIDNSICTGQSVTFTALATGATTFEFFVNGISVQNLASSTYTTSLLTNGATVFVKAGNASSCSTSSNVITTAVQKLPAVTLSSSDTDNTICAGEPVTFTAASDIGINYEFILAGVSVQNGNLNTYATTSLTDGQTIFVKVTSAEGCTVSSTAIKTTVFSVPTITLTSSDTDNQICLGESVSFTATEITSATYEFIRNGSVVLAGPQRVYTTNLLTDGDEITVRVTSANNCTGVSNTIRTRVNSIPSLTLSSSDADNTICEGESVTFTAISDIATRYEFLINGTVVQNSASNSYSTSTLIHGQSIAVRVATPSGCTDLSSAITFTVNPLPVKPTVSVTAGTAVFCQQGTNHVTLQSSESSGNQWLKDGILLPGETNQTITLIEVAHSGKYAVQVTNSNYCKSLLSNPLTVTVHSLPVANLPVSVNAGVCEGTSANVSVSGSQTGINYELYHNTTLISGPVGGTGNTITLSTGVLSPGAYTLIVKATNPVTGCSIELANTASVTINTAPSVSLSSSNGGNSICPGESVTFTANSATAVNYEFFVDGLSKQNGPSHQFTTSILTNNQTVNVEVTSAENCKKQSNSLLIDVNPLLVTVSSSDPNNNICAGEPVTFTASASIATVSNYEFFVNGLSQQNGPANTFTTSLLTNGQTVTVKATTTTGCSATSSGITTIVNALPVIALSSTDSDNKICQGESITFTANAPTATTYEFFVNGLSVQNSATNLYTTSLLTNGQTVTVKATTATGCSATSSGITTTVNPLPAVSLSSSDADNTICQGEQVTFTANSATAVNYEFFVDGISKQNGTSHQFITNSLTSGQSIAVLVTTAQGCSTMSSAISTVVKNLPLIVLSSSDLDNTICPGETVTFSAYSPTGTNYIFFVDGVSVQNSPSNVYTTSTLSDGQTLKVLVTSADGCSSTSTGITTTVIDFTLTLTSSDADNTICPGEAVTFTAVSSAATSFEFFVNGLSVQSGTSNTFTTSSLTDGQLVYVKANTSACSLNSQTIKTTIESLTVSLASSDSDNKICLNQAVVFTATAPSTATYFEFFLDGVTVQAGTAKTYTTSALTNGENIWVVARTISGCTATSNSINTAIDEIAISLTSSASDNKICQGEMVTFTANSATAVNYEFFVNGVSVQNSATNLYTTSSLTNGQVLTVKATTAYGCTIVSSGITTAVNAVPVLTLTSSDADNIICQGETVTFTASSTVAASFDFLINGSVVQSGAANTFTTTGLTNGQTVTVRATTTNSCAALSSGITITVNPMPVVSLVSSDADNAICQGETVTFTANSASASNYKFYVNGTLVQEGAFPTYLTSGLTNGQTVTVRATTASGCSTLSSGITTTVNPLPTVVLTSSDVDNI